MKRNRFAIECDLARYALAYPSGAVEAWEMGDVFQDRVTNGVLAAAIASCVVYQAKPKAEQTEWTLKRLAIRAMQIEDVYTSQWHRDALIWHAAVWGPREICWAVSEGFALGQFDVRLWFNVLEEWFPYTRAA